MRTLVDLGEERIAALDRLAKRQDRSRAALVREAVDDYLGRHRPAAGDEAFGLWGGEAPDGLAHQDRVRGEW